MNPEVLEHLLTNLPSDSSAEARLLTKTTTHEDAAIVTIPEGKALVQTLDFFTPIVNNPYFFGCIAASNALSDVYAMGGTPWCAMNIVCFPTESQPIEILQEILRGGADTLKKAKVTLVGGHSVQDAEIKYGLSITGIVDPKNFASNTGLLPGDTLVLTKPLGTGILATAVKALWKNHEEMENTIIHWASHLNEHGATVIQELRLKAATDITGFGLGGHVLEMAEASKVHIEIIADNIPQLPHVYELASVGLVPAGSYTNRTFRQNNTHLDKGVDPILVDIIFDAQTSGGLLLALPEHLLKRGLARLQELGEETFIVGRVLPEQQGPRLHII